METKMANAILGIRAGLRRNDKCCYNYELPSDVIKMIGTMEAYRPAVHPFASPHTSQSQAQMSDEALTEEVDDPSDHLLF